MDIRELKSLDAMIEAFDVMRQMYPNMSKHEYETILPKRVDDGYRMVGVFDGKTCVCCAGFWIGVRFYCGKFIQLDNMVTDKDYRSHGVGKLVVDWIKTLGRTEQCSRILVDSYVENFDAHRFFYREGFIIRGYHLNYMLDKS